MSDRFIVKVELDNKVKDHTSFEFVLDEFQVPETGFYTIDPKTHELTLIDNQFLINRNDDSTRNIKFQAYTNFILFSKQTDDIIQFKLIYMHIEIIKNDTIIESGYYIAFCGINESFGLYPTEEFYQKKLRDGSLELSGDLQQYGNTI
jgi:hypothetical protein